MRKNYLVGVVLLNALLLGACGGSGGSSSMSNPSESNANGLESAEGDANNSSTSTPNTTDTTDTSDLQVASKFVGTYIKGCDWVNRIDSRDGWQIVTYTINLNTMFTEINYYSDPQCSEANSPALMLTESTLVYPGGVRDTAFSFADFVNITPESVTIDGESASPEMAQQLAAEGFFNTSYEIFLKSAIFYFGKIDGDLDGSTPDLRPELLGTLRAPHWIYEASVIGQVAGADASVGVDTALNYNGSYSSGCTSEDDEDSSDGWKIDIYEFNGNALTMSVDYFLDAGCTQAGEQQSIAIEALLRYPGGQVLTPLGNADFVNVTPLEVSTGGQSVSTDFKRYLAEDGFFDTIFELQLLDGDTLYFGDTAMALDASAPQRRPDELDFVDTATAQ